MKKEIYFSIRTVKAKNTEDAIEEVISGNFDESHDMCDKVLTKEELVKELNGKIKHAVLTDEDGDVYGVISYTKIDEMRKKTLELIEEIKGETVSHTLGAIRLESSVRIIFENKTSTDFYLTPTSIS